MRSLIELMGALIDLLRASNELLEPVYRKVTKSAKVV
jgi:hypothetical protein